MNQERLESLSNDFRALQDRIVSGIEAVEAERGGAAFVEGVGAWRRQFQPGGR